MGLPARDFVRMLCDERILHEGMRQREGMLLLLCEGMILRERTMLHAAMLRKEMVLREATMQGMPLREWMTLREGRMLCEGICYAEHAMPGGDAAPGDGTTREDDAAH